MSASFNNQHDGIAPASSAFAITPHDSNALTNVVRGIYVGGAGDIKVNMAGTGTAVVFTGVPAGTLLPIRATLVYATDTDATSLVGIY